MTIPAEDRSAIAPPVVAVMVVHEPGDWFDEVLTSLAAQTYSVNRLVALLTGTTSPEAGDLIRRRFPDALVRQVEGNPGFGPVVNQVLGLVDAREGFFLVLHDDVALAPDAVARMVEEAFRSNAAVVGPKLVEWGAPDVLQHVGLEADRGGRMVGVVDPGERDQQQHDAVRDVFALPSACLLVRKDVFRTLEGFAPNVQFLGEELDFCWRVHVLGARVVVNPSAVGRHRGAFLARAGTTDVETLRERNRVRIALACASAAQLPALVVRLAVGALLDVVFGLVNGDQREAFASLKAVVGAAFDMPAIIERRRMLRPLRRVPGREVSSLQLRGSARIVAFRRHRRALREQVTSESPALVASVAPGARNTTFAGLALAIGLVAANRGLIIDGVSAVGQFMPLAPDGASPLDVARGYLVGWSPGWFGATASAPTYMGVTAVLGLLFFGNWAGLLAAIVVGSFFVGAIGAWRLCGAIGEARTRMFGALVYVLIPVGVLAVRDGRRDALILWALLPWILDFSRRVAGLSRDGRNADRETSVRPPANRRAQLTASLLLVVAGASTFGPSTIPTVGFLALLLVVAALFTATPWRATVRLVGAPLVAVVGALVLHVPWSVRFVSADAWGAIVGPRRPPTGASIVDILSFGVENVVWRWLILGAYLPVVVMPFVCRGARAAWPTRALVLVAAPAVLLLAGERGLLAIAVPEPLMLSAVMALGLVVAAAAAFDEFLASRRGVFTWRGLVAWLAVASTCVAAVPGIVAGAGGRWSQPPDTLGRLIGQLPGDLEGDYAVVYLGDPRLLPVASVEHVDGVAYGVVRDGGMSGIDTLAPEPSTMTVALARAVEVLLTGESLRAGRLLAPLGVRFVVVPLRDGTLVAARERSGGPVGVAIVDRLADQLDFRRVYTATDLVIFENAAAVPVAAVLNEDSALASRQASEANLLAQPLVTVSVPFSGLVADASNVGRVAVGTTHLAVPFSDRWTLGIDGTRVEPRVAFGATTAFDAPIEGEAVLDLRPSASHRLLVALQLVLWLMVLAVAFNPSRFRGRARAAREVVEVSFRGDETPGPT